MKDFAAPRILEKSVCVLLIAFAVLVDRTQAASIVANVANGDWNSTSTWTPAVIPTGTDSAFIRLNRTVNVTTSAVAQVVNMSNQAGAGTLNIASTGTLNIANGTGNALTMANIASGTATVNVNGGLLSVTGLTLVGNAASSVAAVNVSSGTYSTSTHVRVGAAAGSLGSLNVSGGRTIIGDTLAVGYSGTGSVVISGGTVSTASLSVSTQAGSSGSINISGGRLEVAATDSYIGERVTGTSTGSFTQTGGTVLLGTSGEGRLMLGVANAAGQTINSTATISGGVFTGRLLIGANDGVGVGNGVLTIVGDDATIGSSSVTGNGLELRSSGKIVFQLDASGISTLDYSSSNVAFSSGCDLWIDGSAYTGGAQTFTLIDAGSFSNGNLSTIDESIFGFASGYTTNLFFDGTDLKLEITGVPEPSTWALLGLGFGVLVWRAGARRRSS